MNVILTIFIIYLVFRLLGRFVLPYVLKSFVGRMTDRMSGFEEHFKNSADSRVEGDVTIETKSNTASPSKNLDGDYVDYEELE